MRQLQAASCKLQAASCKLQAASCKLNQGEFGGYAVKCCSSFCGHVQPKENPRD
jgi:hypothetical protein